MQVKFHVLKNLHWQNFQKHQDEDVFPMEKSSLKQEANTFAQRETK